MRSRDQTAICDWTKKKKTRPKPKPRPHCLGKKGIEDTSYPTLQGLAYYQGRENGEIHEKITAANINDAINNSWNKTQSKADNLTFEESVHLLR